MSTIVLFMFNNILLGFGLAMDAFSMALTDGMAEPSISKKKGFLVSSTYGLFQFFMPLIGWLGVHTVATMFDWFANLVPWIAFILLAYIGGDMLKDGIESLGNGGYCDFRFLTVSTMLVQAFATSIDALSVGFTIASYGLKDALITCGTVGLVTFATCLVGVQLGKKIGNHLACRAYIIGGIILILLGLRIFISGVIM